MRTINFFRTHKFKLSILFLLLFMLFINLFWLFFFILFLIGLYLLYIKITKNHYFYLILFPFAFLGAICLAILTRLFVLEIYNIPSESMEDALFTGDRIVVSKLSYGPQIPLSPLDIPWLNLFFNRSASGKKISWGSYKRLGGYSGIKRGDVIVFKNNGNNKAFLVKRCLGLPGEFLHIQDARVEINGHLLEEFPSVKRRYKIWIKDNPDLLGMKKLRQDYAFNYSDGKKIYAKAILNNGEKSVFLQSNLIDSITNLKKNTRAFPYSDTINWSQHNFGPVLIPAAGLTIRLNKRNSLIYKQSIKEEQSSFYEKNGKFYLGNRSIKYYTFQHNYYFMLGDNRNNSLDSRSFGFVSEQKIEGQAIFVIFPKKHTGEHWFNNIINWL